MMLGVRLLFRGAMAPRLREPPTSVKAGRASMAAHVEMPAARRAIVERRRMVNRARSLRLSRTGDFPRITTSEALRKARGGIRTPRPVTIIGTPSLLRRMQEERRGRRAIPLRARTLAASSQLLRPTTVSRSPAAMRRELRVIRSSTHLLRARAATPTRMREIADISSPATIRAATPRMAIARLSICTSPSSSRVAPAHPAIEAEGIAPRAIAAVVAATALRAPAADRTEAVVDPTEAAGARHRKV